MPFTKVHDQQQSARNLEDDQDVYTTCGYDDQFGLDGEVGRNYAPPAGGSGLKNLGREGAMAPGMDPGYPGIDPAYQKARQHVQQWKAQFKSPEWIYQQLQTQGFSPQDAFYLVQGGGFLPYGQKAYPSKYMQNGKYQSWGNDQGKLIEFMQKTQELQDDKAMQRGARKMGQEQKVKVHMVLLQIMMGDIVGALRSYAALMDRDMRQFTRQIVKKLGAVRKARSTIIRNFARSKPPRAYGGQNPAQMARSQDRTTRHNQYVQMSTQLMNQLQDNERELVDSLQTVHRQVQTFWESYAGFRDQEFRTNERVMTMR